MTGSATCLAGRCDRRDDDMDQDGEDGIVLSHMGKHLNVSRADLESELRVAPDELEHTDEGDLDLQHETQED